MPLPARLLTMVVATCLLSATGLAQPEASLTTRTVNGGITVSLPRDWQPVDAAERAATERRVAAALSTTKDSLMQAALRNGQPVFLLREAKPGVADLGANINAAPSPGARVGAFDMATADQLNQAMAGFCNSFAQVLQSGGGRLIRCDDATLEHIGGHAASVRSMVRTGPSGFVSIWIVQFPDQDVIYTLTLTAPQAQAAGVTPMFQQIWRSMRIPSWTGTP